MGGIILNPVPPMKLSVLIVTYNSGPYTFLCLDSLEKASAGLDTEVWVVDNHSQDGGPEYLQQAFPRIHLIRNEANEGYARANNRAAGFSGGEYLLLLNPDTILPGDSLRQILQFMDEHPRVGALGVPMIDGRGKFLRESKRSFPDPWSGFFKLSGLSLLFPGSERISRYDLGQVPRDQAREVEVLCGAFMLIRKKAWEAAGGFDPSFFLYGEDIDLSWKIRQAGFINYYFTGTSILHFKGRSLARRSSPQIRLFYQAMDTFVDKHYGSGIRRRLRPILHAGITLRRISALGIAAFIRMMERAKGTSGNLKTRPGILGSCLPGQNPGDPGNYHFHEGRDQEVILDEARRNRVSDILFCPGTFSYQECLDLMKVSGGRFRFWFPEPEAWSRMKQGQNEMERKGKSRPGFSENGGVWESGKG